MVGRVTKCLLCDETFPNPNLSFFKFPSDDLRFKLWSNAISSVEHLGKITKTELKRKGRICANHFQDSDFVDESKKALIETACPVIAYLEEEMAINKEDIEMLLPDNLIPQTSTIDLPISMIPIGLVNLDSPLFIGKQRFLPVSTSNISQSRGSTESPILHFTTAQPNESASNSDTFQCGKCKEQFTTLSEFMSHKRINCMEPQAVNLAVPLSASNILLNLENKQFQLLETETGDMTITSPAEEDIISFYVNENGELTTQVPSSQMIVTTDVAARAPDVQENVITNIEICSMQDSRISEEEANILVSFEKNQEKEEKLEEKRPKQREILKHATKWQCCYCNKEFDKSFTLQQHERTHTGERPFQCVICGRAFSQKSNVRKHMTRHKVWPDVRHTLKMNVTEKDNEITLDPDALEQNRTIYACQYCPESFKTYFLYKKHLSVHSEFKVYRCIQKECEKTYNDLDEFLTHADTHRDHAEFQCHICHKSFNDLSELGSHQYDHGPSALKTKNKTLPRKVKCNICNSAFNNIESLRNHHAVESHNYECPQCKSAFTSERYLRRHLVTHLDPSKNKFQCLECNKTFRTEKLLLRHSSFHCERKPFTCLYCEKQFNSNFALVRHVGMHWKRRLECPFKTYLGCDKKFYRKDKLHSHILTHSTFKLRPCQVCSKSFSTALKLERHIKREHPTKQLNGAIKSLKCAKCSQMFRKNKQMSQHYCTVDDKLFKTRERVEEAANEDEAEMMEEATTADETEMVEDSASLEIPNTRE